MNFLLIYDDRSAEAKSAARLLDYSLKSTGHYTIFLRRELISPASYAFDFDRAKQKFTDLFNDISFTEADMMLVFGGDGSILNAVQMSTSFGFPVMGFNYGRLGYLSNRFEGDVCKFFDAFLAEYQPLSNTFTESRHGLICEVFCKDAKYKVFALNEFSFIAADQGRILDYRLLVNSKKIQDTRSDSLIIASATGSTAYALSAGGPIMSPYVAGMICVPLAPHAIVGRPLVVSEKDFIELDFTFYEVRQAARVVCDGNVLDIGDIKKVKVCSSVEETLLLRYKQPDFYSQVSSVFF
ncbi:MAG: NAD(+)/NADH kinase [Eggerthellaceae bacterium]|nr:NAD(+)/NADH kinase [Eggerthellaceae bacterium]